MTFTVTYRGAKLTVEFPKLTASFCELTASFCELTASFSELTASFSVGDRRVLKSAAYVFTSGNLRSRTLQVPSRGHF